MDEESRPVLDLKCELGLQRQVNPVRTTNCLHLQTVDLASMLAMLTTPRLEQLARQEEIREELLRVSPHQVSACKNICGPYC